MNSVLKLAVLTLALLGSMIGFTQQRRGVLQEISLERQPCFGGCPVYKVTIKSDGTIVYTGKRYVERIGKFKAQVNPETLKKLQTALKKLEFSKLKSRYEVSMTDQATQIVKVVNSRGTKTVTEYGNSGPAELWAVETMIDGVVNNARGWEKIED